MTNKIARPESFFADRFGLTSSRLERLLGSALRGRVEDADLYLEYRVNEELVLEEGGVKKASRHVSQGAGVRAQSGERTGYAHTDALTLTNLEEAARQARAIADQSGESAIVAVRSGSRPHDLYPVTLSPVAADLSAKVDLLRQIDTAARAADPRVQQVIASLSSEEQITLIAQASGWTVGDVRPLTRLSITVIAEEHGISPHAIYGWLSRGAIAPPTFGELAKLRRENQMLTELIGKITIELSAEKKKGAR